MQEGHVGGAADPSPRKQAGASVPSKADLENTLYQMIQRREEARTRQCFLCNAVLTSCNTEGLMSKWRWVSQMALQKSLIGSSWVVFTLSLLCFVCVLRLRELLFICEAPPSAVFFFSFFFLMDEWDNASWAEVKQWLRYWIIRSKDRQYEWPMITAMHRKDIFPLYLFPFPFTFLCPLLHNASLHARATIVKF